MKRDAGFDGENAFSEETSVCSAASAASLSATGAVAAVDVELAVVERDRLRALNAGRTRNERAVELVGETVSSMAFSSTCFSSVEGTAVVVVRKLKRLRAAIQKETYLLKQKPILENVYGEQ